MRQLEGVDEQQRPRAVCSLRKSLYRTKEAGDNWNKEVNSFITARLRARSATRVCTTVCRALDDRC